MLSPNLLDWMEVISNMFSYFLFDLYRKSNFVFQSLNNGTKSFFLNSIHNNILSLLFIVGIPRIRARCVCAGRGRKISI